MTRLQESLIHTLVQPVYTRDEQSPERRAEPVEIVDALRVAGRNSQRVTAAVDLLVSHGRWLRDPAFLDEVLEWPLADVAFIDWVAAGKRTTTHPTTTDDAVLAVAVSLASGNPIDLASVIGACDRVTAALVVEAIAKAAGVHSRRAITADMIGV